MMAAWMAYTISVTLLVGLAAVGIERVLRLFSIPARLTWTTAMAASMGLPLWFRLRPTAPVTDAPGLGAALPIDPVVLLDLIGPATESAAMASVNLVLAALWIGASLVIAMVLVATQIRLHREVRRWPTEVVGGVTVRVTRALGPAVVGFPSVIVLPDWVRRLDPGWQSLVVTHEHQHLDAGDAPLLFAGLVAAVLVPWNIPFWWQLRRLRDAIELDCDARLLRSGASARNYSELLLEVARQGKPALFATALSNPKSLLARRIDMMTDQTPRARWPRAGLAAATATLFMALACETPIPAALDFDDQTGTATGVSAVYLENAVEKRPARLSGPAPRYPAMLREAGIEGTVLLEFVIDETGRVDSNSINVLQSAHDAFVAPATGVISRSLYTPGEMDGEAVPVLVQQQIGFTLQAQALRRAKEVAAVLRARVSTVQPLVFVDEVEVTRVDLTRLSPDEIARIEVLKGAAAATLYGERGANGVIQIFTKDSTQLSVVGRRGNR